MSMYYTGKGDDGESRVGRKKYPKTGVEFAALGDLDELNSLLGIMKSHLALRAGQGAENMQCVALKKDTSPPNPLSLQRRGGQKRDIILSSEGEVNREYLCYLIECIQQDLFIIQAHVGAFWFEKEYKPPSFSRKKIQWLEEQIAKIEKNLPPIKKFVVPGADGLSAWLDYARAVARRAERSVAAHHAKHPLDSAILSYCNRISSLLFVLARTAALQSDIPAESTLR